jgi:K+-transporting ATPase ATPase F chain
MDRRAGGVLVGGGGGGLRPRPADARKGSAQVIAVEVLYGLGALIAVLLFAYLVFALICAEEF